MATIQATPGLIELQRRFLDARRIAEEAIALRDDLNQQLKAALLAQAQAENPLDPLTHTELVVGDVRTVLEQRTGTRFDTTRFKTDYPQVWQQYAKPTSSMTLTVRAN